MSDSNKSPVSGATVVANQGDQGPGTPPPVSSAPSAPVPTDAMVGTVLAGRYEILKRLGEGGMGTVYLAEHTTINKKLAVKVLSTEYSHKQDLVDRFLQEARAASMIEQENVVEITDFGSTPDGSVFFVMEFLNGEDLSHTVEREGALPWARIKPIMLQICRALQAAHERGIIHRDMKPENCYRIRRGRSDDFIKVLDFGIAKVTSDEGEGGKGLTRTGMIFGTPEYMSPEQAKGEKPDHRVDVYATGVILYELLTGRVPFTADTFMGILTKHMFEAPPAPSQVAPHASIPPEVENIILKALQKDREYRFQDMGEMADAIEAVGSGSAAVGVVQENIARPTEGKIGFTQMGAPEAGTYPPSTGTGEFAAPRSSNKGMIFGIAGVLVVGAAVGTWALLGNEEPPPEEPAPVVAAPPPPAPEPEPEPAPEPEPEPKVLPAATPKVTFKIKTPGVQAQILDARDEGMYGKTNSDEGVEVEKSDEPVELILRADGYEDLAVSIVPNRDKTFTKKLEQEQTKRRRRRSRRRSRRNRKRSKPTPKKPTSDKKPTSKPDKKSDKKPPRKGKKRIKTLDLKDPFQN